MRIGQVIGIEVADHFPGDPGFECLGISCSHNDMDRLSL